MTTRATYICTTICLLYVSSTNIYADKFVNNTMSYTDINNTIASAVSGEDVHFAGGTLEAPAVYQLPQVTGVAYTLNNQGVDLVADGAVTLRGATITSGRVVRINSVNGGLYDLTLENAKFGVELNANFEPSLPIIIQGNTIQDVDTGIY